MLKQCEFGHTWEDYAECPVCALNKKLQKYMAQGMFGSAKNLAEWYFHIGNDRLQGDRFPEIAIALSAWELSDLSFAAEQFEKLKDCCAPSDRLRMVYHLHEYEEMKQMAERNNEAILGPEVSSNDPRLEEILRRLACIFYEIRRPVTCFAADSEESYNEYMAAHLPKENAKYASFEACGFYSDPNAYHIICKKELIEKMDEYALTGLLAHETAHLELTDKGIRKLFFQPGSGNCREDIHMNEHLTDLYVISKGLAYPLWCSRKSKKEESGLVLDKDDIFSVICKLDQRVSLDS